MTTGYTDNGAFLQSMLEEEEKLFHEIRCEGVAAYEGLMGMARVIGARERARPVAPDPEFRGCNRRHPSGGSVRCNLANDHTGPHKKIGRTGNVNYTWSSVEPGPASPT